MVEIKRVSYAYNSALEAAGQQAYFLDCLVSRDGVSVVDKHEGYKTRDEFYEAIEKIVPVLEGEQDDAISTD